MKTLDEYPAIQFLQQHGLPVVPTELTTTPQEAIRAADTMGYPVVMKISSNTLAHKTEVGGILLNLSSQEDVSHGFEKLSCRAEKAGLNRKEIRGILVQKMESEGFEFIIGGYRDDSFGPTVMFGLGGIYTELFNDTAFRLAPFDTEEAKRMVRETKSSKIITGFRGQPPLSEVTLTSTLAKISELMDHHQNIIELDINPFLLKIDGGFILDGLIKMEE